MEFFDSDILLTPNRRLAATLTKQHQQVQMAQGKHTWSTLTILPLTSWLENNWHDYISHETTTTPLLLTPQQEQILWEDIIRQSPESEYLLHVSQTAKLIFSAWQVLKQWNVPLSHPELALTEDSQLFQKWAKQYQQQCHEKNWLDHASLPNQLSLLIQQQKITLPKKIKLTGFIDISPQIQALLTVCEQQGVIISYSDPVSLNQNTQQLALTDKEHEITTMARWAKANHEKNPTAKIACIIPDLENCRSHAERIFHAVFAEDDAQSFNISAGKKLTTYPVIHTALQLLSLSTSPISLEKLSHLFRSPFLGHGEKESQKRALYENYLRHINVATISLKQLTEANTLKFAAYCPMLRKRFSQYLEHLSNSKKMPPSGWATFFNEGLSLLGWPGERSVNSEELQVIQNGWLPLLNEFAKLDLVLSTINHSKALHYLTQLAEKTIFQAQTPETAVQVLGLLEAAGLSFDYLWVMGLDDTAWPAQPSPNPFIPLRLQKQLNMPNASAERELTYCKKLTEQFIASSQSVFFSYSLQDDKSMQRPSALIKHLPKAHYHELTLGDFTPIDQTIFSHKQLESFSDPLAPALHPDEPIRGGASIFKLQAACPFKAFAEIRLNAREFESPTTGLRPQDRGTLLHKVLELIWRQLQTSAKLHESNNDELNTLIITSIDQAFTELAILQHSQHLSRYLTIEKKRIEKIILQWLALEKTRPPFKVAACEQELTTTIANIPLKLRIDRIDELAENEFLLIDYKSAKNNSITSWFSERPGEPQLPLYCIIDPKITGISFAELYPDNLQFKGISQKPLAISSIKPIDEVRQSDVTNWPGQIAQWQTVLTKLGDDFYQGVADVNPKNINDTCNQCHLHSLCRIYES